MSKRVRLVLARHAESAMNVNHHIVSGRSNETPLTPHGDEQAAQLGHFIAALGIKPREAFTSPAVRAVRTGRIALESAGIKLDLVYADALQELDQGEWVGKPRDEIYTEETLAEIRRLGKDFHAPAGESMNGVGRRMHEWAENAIPPDEALDWSNDEEPTYIAFTHGVAIKCFASELYGWDEDRTYRTQIGNATLSSFVRVDGTWQLEYIGRSAE